MGLRFWCCSHVQCAAMCLLCISLLPPFCLCRSFSLCVMSELLSVWYVAECVTIVVRRFYIDTIDCDDKRFYDTILSAINADLWMLWQYLALCFIHTNTRTPTEMYVLCVVCAAYFVIWLWFLTIFRVRRLSAFDLISIKLTLWSLKTIASFVTVTKPASSV